VLTEVTEDYEIIFVADPCTDRTVELLRAEHQGGCAREAGAFFSRRFGQPAATNGRDDVSRGAKRWSIIDCDLQDPPRLISRDGPACGGRGNKVVIPQRTSREGETLIKRIVLVRRVTGVINRNRDRADSPANTGGLFACSIDGWFQEIVNLRESHGFPARLDEHRGIQGRCSCRFKTATRARGGRGEVQTV